MDIVKLCKLLVLICTFSASVVSAERQGNAVSVIGQVVRVLSGDSLHMLLPNGELVRIQLAGINSPSIDRPMGQQSLHWLASQLHNQLVSAECAEIEDSLHCVVFPDDRDINLTSLHHGFSVCDEGYIPDANLLTYRLAERHAREKKRGVWAN